MNENLSRIETSADANADPEVHAQTEAAREHFVAGAQPVLDQQTVSDEIAAIHRSYRERAAASDSPLPTHPPRNFLPYRSSALRHPTHELVRADPEEIELVSPAFGHTDVGMEESDLTIQHPGEPLGERIIVTGRVLDGEGRPVRNQLIEIWQANASGRYVHKRDQHPAPLDPNFTGVGRVITGEDGSYRLTTIKPGPYPWKNHRNAWRPAHIHFSFFGSAFAQRLITQMYFPGDSLFALDPIYQSIVDPAARERLIARYDHEVSEPEWALGFRWDVVLTGPRSTWMEPEDADHA